MRTAMPKLNNNMRSLGRAIAIGTRGQIIQALDRVVQPRSEVWERLSDLALGFVADAIVDGRTDLIAGVRAALDEVPE